MTNEFLQAKRFLGIKFGYGEPIKDGIYAVPTQTSKGKAFMKIEYKNQMLAGDKNFHLYWDEKLTLNWYETPKPFSINESKFSKLFRKIEAALN